MSIASLAANGLGVIGGNTVNLVGLGGCLAESTPARHTQKNCGLTPSDLSRRLRH